MSEFLTVRMSRQEDKPVNWLVWSSSQNEIIASGELTSRDQLDELTTYARQRTTILLLDSSDIVLSEVDIPAGASRQLDKMLPYIMEEDIAQDVEKLHFHVLRKIASTAYVSAIESDYLKHTLEKFKKQGIEVKKVLPDVLALPVSDDEISAAQLDGQWLLRKDEYQGAIIDTEWLPYFVSSDWFTEHDKEKQIACYTPVPKLDDQQIEWIEKEPELVMQLLAKGAIFSSINMLSGPFKPQSAIFKNLQVWKSAAFAACLFLLVLSVKSYIEVDRAEAQGAEYRAESERIFRTIFPDKRRIPTVSYLKRQMNDEENRLSGAGSEDSVLHWLSRLPNVLKGKNDIKITAIRYDAKRGEMRIEAEMADFQTFEVVRTELAKSFSVTQGPLDRDGKKVTGSFTLRRQG